MEDEDEEVEAVEVDVPSGSCSTRRTSLPFPLSNPRGRSSMSTSTKSSSILDPEGEMTSEVVSRPSKAAARLAATSSSSCSSLLVFSCKHLRTWVRKASAGRATKGQELHLNLSFSSPRWKTRSGECRREEKVSSELNKSFFRRPQEGSERTSESGLGRRIPIVPVMYVMASLEEGFVAGGTRRAEVERRAREEGRRRRRRFGCTGRAGRKARWRKVGGVGGIERRHPKNEGWVESSGRESRG